VALIGKARRNRLSPAKVIALGAASFLGLTLMFSNAEAFNQSPPIQLFGTNLRGVGPGGIPVAAPDHTPAPVTKVTHYSIDITKYSDQVTPLSSGLGPTTFFGYNPVYALGGDPQPQKHLGGIIVGEKGTPIQITFKNFLGTTSGKHILPNDTTILGADAGNFRTATHLHGGLVPWISDGGPYSWFGPNGDSGISFLNNQVLNPHADTGEAEYYYPLNQSARFLWYHDHAFGITRLNAYAGIASALLIRDDFERGLQSKGLPPFIETSVLGGTSVLELPLVIQDKIFVGPTNPDTSWSTIVDSSATTAGSLWYAHVYDTTRYGKLGPAPDGPPPDPSVVPEFFGDTMLANGTVYPQVTVDPRRYRFRILNACNARFLNLQLYEDDGTPNGITLDSKGNPLNKPVRNAAALDPAGKPTSNFLVLGTEGGFLPSPAFVPSNLPFNPAVLGGSLVLAPAERVDVLVDLSLHAGKNLILYSDAPSPFPEGDPLNDYFPGLNNKNPVNAQTNAGFGPNTRVIMRFNVGTSVSSTDTPLTITKATNLAPGNDPLLRPLGVTALPQGVKVRRLTLNEAFDEHGRLIQLLGTDVVFNPATAFGRAYTDPATETPTAGDTEVWQIANLTGDTHPIHFHLVNVQIISRQAFSVSSYKGGAPNLTGAPIPPPPEERGWKETVRMNPGEVTTVIMKFDLPANPPHVASIPVSPRTGGFEYVWHCHILEHEEHDMMRPLVVLPLP